MWHTLLGPLTGPAPTHKQSHSHSQLGACTQQEPKDSEEPADLISGSEPTQGKTFDELEGGVVYGDSDVGISRSLSRRCSVALL